MIRSKALCLLGCLPWVQLSSCASNSTDNEAAQLDLGERPSAQSLDEVDELPGESLTFDVSAEAMTFVSLRDDQVAEGASRDSTDWDLAFRGWDVFTNSGPSGHGHGGGFGPLAEADFLLDRVPEVPFLRSDATGGPFLGWYAYDDETHQLWSRYHVYAVRQAELHWKVQVLGYYGQQFGAPVSAMYRVRYAALNAESNEHHEVTELDATAGYPDVDDSKPSGCLDLASGQTHQLTPEQARESEAWHLCFRRDSIRVNGEEGGPGQVSAVDLDANRTADETLADVQGRTAESEFERFDDVDSDRLTDAGLNYRGDRVVSVFDDEWFEGRGNGARPAPASWLVLGADGEQFYMVVFRQIRGTSAASGAVTLQVRRVRE